MDYVPAAGTLTFTPGETAKPISLAVAFTNTTNANIGGYFGIIIIIIINNDD